MNFIICIKFYCKRRGGGVGFFVKSNIEYDVIKTCNADVSYAIIKFKVENIVVCGIYLSEKTKTNGVFQIFDGKFQNMYSLYQEKFIFSDFNVDYVFKNSSFIRLLDICR